MSKFTDTIFAPATPVLPAGLTVFRVSGNHALNSLKLLTKKEKIEPRKAVLATIFDPENGQKIDEGLILFFPNPNSYTGEDVIEYHLHGGRAIADAFINAISNFNNHRMAEPGEFTRRAFENGKLDLTQAEAVADLIHAETEQQRVQALDQLGGVLKDLYEGWADDLTNAMAYIEADIDFADEDLPNEMSDQMRPILTNIIDALTHHLDDNHQGERLRDGIRIAVIGAPNAGKSSLINHLAKRDIAIVTDTPGTTRDIIEVHLNIGGYPVIMADTAGLRKTEDKIEEEGVQRAKNWADQADLKIALFDGDCNPDPETLDLINEQTLVFSSKCDHGKIHKNILNQEVKPISTQTGEGIDDLLFHVKQFIENKMTPRDTPSLTRQRHRQALTQTMDHLNRALQTSQTDMMAEDVRLALRSLGSITGKVDVEDLLDVIFDDFCIGK